MFGPSNLIFKTSLALIFMSLASCGWMESSLLSTSFEVVLRHDSTKPYSNTVDRTFNFDVLGSDFSHYEYRLNPANPHDANEPWNVVTSSTTSTTSLHLTGLTEGHYLLQLRAVSQTGAVSKVTSFEWDVDLTPPSVSFSGSPATLTSENAAVFTFTATDDVHGVGIARNECRFDGTPTWNTCSAPYTLAPLLNGDHVLTVRSVDKAGNVSPEVQHSWHVDLLAPKITISSPATLRGGGANGSVSWRLTEKNVPAGAFFQVEFYDGSSWSALDPVAATAGTNNNHLYTLSNFNLPSLDIPNALVRIRLEDAVGHIGESTSQSFPVEVTPPLLEISGLELADGQAVTHSPDINVSLSVASHVGVISEMMLSEDPSFTGSSWDVYTSEKVIFHLSSLSGLKTVYAKVRTLTGLESNVVSNTIDYQSEDPPVVAWVGPAESTPISSSTGAVTLSWSCSSSNLPAYPIKTLMYSVDDGVNFHVIGTDLPNNDSTTTGHLDWTPPAVSPLGVLITPESTMKFRIQCQSAIGLVSGAESGLYNSSWRLYAGGNSNQDNIHISTAVLGRGAFFADKNNHLYFIKNNNALMKVNRQTGIVSTLFGKILVGGCDSNQLEFAELLGISSDGNTAFVVSGSTCPRLFSINLQNGTATFRTLSSRDATNDTDDISRMYGDRYYIYFENHAYYYLDIQNPSSTPKKLIGQGGACGPAANVGTPATQSPLPCVASGGYGLVVSRDGSKIWISVGTTKNVRLDGSFAAGFTIGNIDKAELMSNFLRCVTNNSDVLGKTWMCRGNSALGNKVVIFDEENEEVPSTYNLLGYKDNAKIRVALGTTSNSVLALSTANELFELKFQSGTWQKATIVSNPLMTVGNGTDLSRMDFTDIEDLVWNDATQSIYIRGANHLRRIKYSLPSYDLDSIATAVNFTVFNNSVPVPGLAASADGTLLVSHSYSNITRLMKKIDLTSFNAATESISAGSPADYIKSGSTAVFPTYGANFAVSSSNGKAVFNRRFLSEYGGDGYLYFMGDSRYNDLTSPEENLTLFRSNGTTINFIAGAEGAAAMAPAGTGNALGNPLKEVVGLQRASDGNLWLIDDYRLKKITILDSPVMYVDTIDYSLLPNYPSTIHNWTHAKYDENTDWTYFALAEAESADGKSQVWAVHPDYGWQQLSLSGLTVGKRPSTVKETDRIGDLRLEITPFGLLLLDNANRRILIHDLLQ